MPTFLAGKRVLVQDLIDAFPVHVGVTVNAFSVASNSSTYFAIQFALQSSSNTTGMWALAAPTRLIAPTAGTYRLSGFITWPATLSTADGRGEFRVNGSGTAINTAKCGTVHGSTGNASGAVSGTVVLQANDYLELYCNQNSGSANLLNVALSMERMSAATS